MVAPGQCALEWQSGLGLTGVDGTVYDTMMWDADGPGPAPELLVLVGAFEYAGDVAARNIAAFDPASGEWSALGSGLNSTAYALASDANGDLVVAGYFSNAGGIAALRVARWNGSSWSGLPGISSASAASTAIAVLPGGDVVAAGYLGVAGSPPSRGVVRWDGTTWSRLATSDNEVNRLYVLANGDLLAGGSFSLINGLPRRVLARWDGVTWSGLGLNNAIAGYLTDVAQLPGGNLLAAGLIPLAGGAVPAALWNGAAWTAIAPISSVGALLAVPGGAVATGSFTAVGSTPAPGLAYWDGSTWTALGSASSAVGGSSLTLLPNGDLAIGGGMTSTRFPGQGVVRFAPGGFAPLGAGISGWANAITTLPSGEVAVGGGFNAIGGLATTGIATWDGTAWSALGGGVGGGSSDQVETAVLHGGALIVGGRFTTAGGSPVSCIASWNGSAWSDLGGGVTGTAAYVRRFLSLPGGDLLVAGTFATAGGVNVANIARWDGTSYAPLGTGTDDWVSALLPLPNGDLLAGGAFGTAGGVAATGVARWDGTSWSAFGTLLQSAGAAVRYVSALAQLPDGTLVAGGWFSTPGGATNVARWDGSAWQGLGTGLPFIVFGLHALPNGDLLAVGVASGSTGYGGIARWNGSSWSPVAGGTEGFAVRTVHSAADGSLLLGGRFRAGSGTFSWNLARLTNDCLASVANYGATCAGSAGVSTISSQQLPWVGTTLQASVSNVPANALGVAVWGLAPAAVPLPTLLPQGVPGCALLASPDVVLPALAPAGGELHTMLAIPNSAVFAGVMLFHQVGIAEFGSLGQVVALTSSDGLRLEIGSL
ncbi:MAG: hypothetical protein KDE27_12580 [Planctomycetes bacterium]|nr:hypothetical protein [Planctomycetota bacterium]